MKLTTFLILAGLAAQAQPVTEKRPTTDAEKIADALRAGPAFITKDATILDWPSTPTGEYKVLRAGTSEWTCLPAVPGYPHDEPGCFERFLLKWIQDGLAERVSHIDSLGIAYMYVGAYVPDKSDHATPGSDFHVGPHVMIISPHQDELQRFSHDGSTGMPYVTHLPHGTDLFLAMPFHQADEMMQAHEASQPQ